MALLRIPAEDVRKIIDHCKAAYPDEACGMLAGLDGSVKKVYCMKNAMPGPVYYEMDPEEQFRVMKDIRAAGLELIGIFHSHPSSPAHPSATDVERAYWPGTLYPNYPGVVYVIVSLMDMSRPVVKGYSIEQGSVNEVELLSE